MPHDPMSLSFGEFEVGSRVFYPQTKQQGTIMTVGPQDYISVQLDNGELVRNTRFYFKPISKLDATPAPTPPPKKRKGWEDWTRRNSSLKFNSFNFD